MAGPVSEHVMRQYLQLRDRAGWVDVSDRTQIEVTGQDRATFLHNFCTNDIKRLAVGQGCEAFFTSDKGKVLAPAPVFCCPDQLIIETVPGQGPRLIEHLERYVIREDVQLTDRSGQWGELLVAGAHAGRLLERLSGTAPPAEPLEHRRAVLADQPVFVRRVGLLGPDTFLVSCSADRTESVGSTLQNAGVEPSNKEAMEMLRIEAGFPLFGVDLTDQCFPQEARRDKEAISFTKGCYLGQETVARIDSMGHVNRMVCGLRLDGTEPVPPDTPLYAGEKPAGHITSAAFSPRLDAPLALAYLRREYSQVGTRLNWSGGEAEVIQLPLQ